MAESGPAPQQGGERALQKRQQWKEEKGKKGTGVGRHWSLEPEEKREEGRTIQSKLRA